MQTRRENKSREMSRLRWGLTSRKKKDQLLRDTLGILRLLPETAALLDLAASRNVHISFNPGLIGTDNSGVTVSSRKTGETRIELKPYRDGGLSLIY